MIRSKSAVSEPLISSIVGEFLEDYLAKMGERLAKGGRLTHSEASLLLVAMTQRDISSLYRRIGELPRPYGRSLPLKIKLSLTWSLG